MRRQPAAASKVRSAAAPSPVRFSDFNSGPPRELGHQLDLRGPALRLPGDVDIFFLAELLFANSGGRWSSADRVPMLMSASPVRGRRGFDAGRAQRDLRGHRQRSPNSAAITLGRSASLAPRCARRCSEQSGESGGVTWFAALTRAREAGRRDAAFICSTARWAWSGRRQSAAASKERSAAAPSPVRFSDFIRGRRGNSVIGSTCAGRRCGCRATSTSSF